MREEGKLDEALTEFQKALEIDPSLFIAKQELRRTQKLISEAEVGNPPRRQPRHHALQESFTKPLALLNWPRSPTYRSP